MAKTIISFEARPGAEYIERAHGSEWRAHYISLLSQLLPKIALATAKELTEALQAAKDLHAAPGTASATISPTFEISLGTPSLVSIKKPTVKGGVKGLRQIAGELKLRPIVLGDIEIDVEQDAFFSEAEMQGILSGDDFITEAAPVVEPNPSIVLEGIVTGRTYTVTKGLDAGRSGVYLGSGLIQDSGGGTFVVTDAAILKPATLAEEEEEPEEPEAPELPEGDDGEEEDAPEGDDADVEFIEDEDEFNEPIPGLPPMPEGAPEEEPEPEPEPEEEPEDKAPTAKEEQELQEEGIAVDRHGVHITLDEWEGLTAREREMVNKWLLKMDEDDNPRMNRVIKRFMKEAA